VSANLYSSAFQKAVVCITETTLMTQQANIIIMYSFAPYFIDMSY